MRKIIYHAATSADGFIARPDGGIDWLDRPEPPGGYGLKAFYRTVDTVILGRKTWEVGRRLGQPLFPGKRNCVFSRRRKSLPVAGIEVVGEDVRRFCRRLRREKGKDVWLIGGADLAGAFLDAGEVDEVVTHVIPVYIGKGIPLFDPGRRTVPLRLVGTRRYADGVVRLHYSVDRKSRKARAPRRTQRSG